MAITIRTRDGRTTVLDDGQLTELRAQVRGAVLRPRDPGFEEATAIWNGMIHRTPALVVQAAEVQDVVHAVDLARERGLRFSVKGGGHNIGGTALVDGGLTLDMSRFDRVEVDPVGRIARVGAGCLLGDVDRATQEHGLATVLGFISETGVAGLTLGGGFGYLARRFGWSVDNLVEAEVVTADGAVRRASRDEHPDLFWAIRGAGHNLGVVTEFTFRLHEVGPTIVGGLVGWPFERAEEIAAAYHRLTERAPRELAAFLVMTHAPPAPFVPEPWQGRRVVMMLVCYTGPLERADEVLAPIRALGEPVFDLVAERPYVEQQSLLDETEPDGMHYYWKTELASELSDEMLATLRELAADCPMPQGEVLVAHIGGALNEHASDDGAVGNRDVRFAFGAAGMWEPGEPRAEEYKRWVRAAGKAIRPFSTGAAYINFQTAEDTDERIRATYGANYERLVQVKAAYDPDNLFQSNRNISPRARPRTARGPSSSRGGTRTPPRA